MSDTQGPMPSARATFNRFFQDHTVAWELTMGALAIAYVAIGFGTDSGSSVAPMLLAVESVVTAIFVGEFVLRLLASYNRWEYLRNHAIDLVALLPVARGLRVARALRLLRLLRTFTSVRRAFTNIDRLANHHELGTLVIAWFGTMFLCATIFYAVESGANPAINDPGDAVWWGIATLTGGTPEVHAVTDEGRIATAALLILGVALFTAITAVLVSFIVTPPTTLEPSAKPVDSLELLRKIKALRDEGLITPQEFDWLRDSALQAIAAG